MEVSVKLKQGSAISYEPAKILIYNKDDCLVGTVTAEVKWGKGADGKKYPYPYVSLVPPKKSSS